MPPPHDRTCPPSPAELLRALTADFEDLQEIRHGIDGLEGSPTEIRRLTSLIDARIYALRDVIARSAIVVGP
jgi:hypothetical protein